MIISVINHTEGLISDAEVQQALRAINRQIAEDFAPYWGMSATLKLEGHAGLAIPSTPHLDGQSLVDMRGEAVIYLWHPIDTRGALGYHSRNFLGIPYGFVFPQVSRSLHESWTISLSHETLEMIADPDVNLLVMGPHPANPDLTVFHWYEMCDAVQAEAYHIDGVPVSNFVLPLYYTNSDEPGSRNDFLNLGSYGRSLRSFGVSPGGYIGFFNPASGNQEAFTIEGDALARSRLEAKGRLGLTRRSQRYQHRTMTNLPNTAELRSYL